MRCASSILTIVLAAASSSADEVTYTRPIDAPLAIGAPLSVSLPRFDIAGATLTGVQLTFHLGPSAHVLIENRMDHAGTFAGSFRAAAEFAAPGGAAAESDQFIILLDPIMLAADDGQTWTGPDCLNLGRLIVERDLFASAGDLAPYIGTGLFDSQVRVTSMLVQGTTGMEFEYDLSAHHLSGEASVTYTYVPVPGAILAMGVGLALLPRRRRVR